VTTSTDVTIGVPPLPPGQVEISNDPTSPTSSWYGVEPSYPWTLPGGQGVKTVYVSYRPNPSSPITASGNASIFLDTGASILSEPALACNGSLYLTEYVLTNRDNSSDAVIKLQRFLNAQMGASLIVNGMYDAETQAAVDKFQLTFNQEILQPWINYGLPNINTPTSQTYKTTQRWINILSCPGLNLPIPKLP